MTTAIAANATHIGSHVKLAVALTAFGLAALALSPSEVPLIGGLLDSANAGTNDDSI